MSSAQNVHLYLSSVYIFSYCAVCPTLCLCTVCKVLFALLYVSAHTLLHWCVFICTSVTESTPRTFIIRGEYVGFDLVFLNLPHEKGAVFSTGLCFCTYFRFEREINAGRTAWSPSSVFREYLDQMDQNEQKMTHKYWKLDCSEGGV